MSTLENSPRILPFLWFDANAEEAVDLYVGIFKNSRKIEELRNPGTAPGLAGAVLTIQFELEGQRFTALNGGPHFQFNQAISFVVSCDTQEEIDYYWSRLSAGGREMQCGWLQDPFGLCWQVVPRQLGKLIQHPKAMQKMLEMKKLDMVELQRAGQS